MTFLPKSTIKDLERAREQKSRTAALVRVYKVMLKKGASTKSMQTVLQGINEYLRLQTLPDKPDTPEPTAHLSDAAPGTLLSEVEAQAVTWLWERRLPLGKITILDGDPGMGKSLLATSLAACVSTGRPMPDGTPGMQGGVILIAPEDDADDTLKPRLEAAGGNSSQVLLLNMVESLDVKKVQVCQRPFSLSDDLEILENAIKRMQAVLVILDPLMAVLGRNVDSSRDQDVRAVFTPLGQLAERTGCAVLIVRHLNKGGADNPLYRGAGSIGIIAAARIGLVVAPDPADEHKRILATTKNNLSKQASNLTYQVVENEQGIPSIQWLGENHYPVKALFGSTNVSYERQAILKALKDSATPLSPKEVAEHTGLNYDNVRKMLSRLTQMREITSPARGHYAALDHPALPTPVDSNSDVSSTTSVTTTTNVTNVTTSEIQQDVM